MLKTIISPQIIRQNLLSLGVEQKTIHDSESDIFLLLSKSLPKNALEMVALCAEVNALLMQILTKDPQNLIPKKKLIQKSLSLRIQYKKDIIAYQKQRGSWGTFKHPEGYLQYAKKCIDLYLGIDEKSSKEYIIDKLHTLNKGTIRDILGLGVAMQGGNFFTKYSDLINHLYRDDIGNQKVCCSYKKWSWKSKPESIKNIKVCLNENLSIKDEDYIKYSAGRYQIRKKLLSITATDIINFGLATSFDRRRSSFKSYLDLLSAAFGEDFELDTQYMGKKKARAFERNTKEITLTTVKENVLSHFSLDFSDCKKDSEEWYKNIHTLITLGKKVFCREMGLWGAINNNQRFSRSHIDVLIQAFPDFSLQRWMFTSLGKFYYKQLTQLHKKGVGITYHEKQLLTSYFHEQASGKDLLYTYILQEMKQYNLNHGITDATNERYSDFQSDVFYKFSLALDSIGPGCKISLKLLLAGAIKSVGIKNHYERLHRLQSKIVNDANHKVYRDNTGNNKENNQMDQHILKDFILKMNKEDQFLIQSFLDGELQLSSKQLKDIVTKYQRF